MMSSRQWLIALALALSLHVLAFISTYYIPEAAAVDDGETGIEIDLGMLGDLGVVVEAAEQDTIEAEQEVIPESEPEPEPIEEVVEEPTPPEPIVEEVKPLPKLDVQPEAKPAEVKVKKQVKAKPVKKVEIKKEVPVDPKPVVKKVVQKKTTKPTTTYAKQATSQKKLTTGRSDSVSTGGNPGAERSYFAEIAAQLTRYKRYPSRSRRRNEEGIVTLFFVVSRDGKVTESRISKSSGYKRLDDAVLKMLRKAAPLPPFPDEMEKESLSINIPISFKLTDSR
ncbi:hypothetical protein A9Q78_00745 [Methylophaga sp. 41_12_T18]|nr:hypothetical protein A9Q78_00745 [Methylophaga sp. 41_12_T18]